jgi:hypothetical protein
MADQDEPTRIEAEDARAGATPHMTRYILGISLVLIIVIYAFLVLR